MKQYAVKITDRGLADMNAIFDYIAVQLQVPETAYRQYERIASAIESLRSLPERYPLLDVEPEHDLGMRRLLVDHYSVIYAVRDDAVTVLRVLYSASDFVSRLREER
jgi:plasmid stabilization system protein ParE